MPFTMGELFGIIILSLLLSVASMAIIFVRLLQSGTPFAVHDTKSLISQVIHPNKAVRDGATVFVGGRLSMYELEQLLFFRLVLIKRINDGGITTESLRVVKKLLDQMAGHKYNRAHAADLCHAAEEIILESESQRQKENQL